MILQIELPSAALVRERIAEAHAIWNNSQISYEELQKRERDANNKKQVSEAELSRALDEGYRVIERYPFSIGDGIHLILYKSGD